MSDVASLQKQIAALQKQIREEREQHAAEMKALEQKFANGARPSTAPAGGAPKPSTASIKPSAKKSPAAKSGARSVSTGGASSSDEAKSVTTQPAVVSVVAKTPDTKAKSGKFSGSGDGSSPGSATKDSKKASSPAASTKTSPQHAWDKFCVIARKDFTVKELSLVTLDTLIALFDKYGVSNPVERAQIEAQWGLLQEGKDRADQPTIHDDSRAPRSTPFEPCLHTSDFVVEKEVLKKSLSNRKLLNPEPAKAGNPNSACDRHRDVSPGGKGGMLKEINGAPSDPSAVLGPYEGPTVGVTSPKKTGRVALTGPESLMGKLKFAPSGKGRSHSPNNGPITPIPMGSPDAPSPKSGVKMSLASKEPAPSPCVGTRFAEQSSPSGSGAATPNGGIKKTGLRVTHSPSRSPPPQPDALPSDGVSSGVAPELKYRGKKISKNHVSQIVLA